MGKSRLVGMEQLSMVHFGQGWAAFSVVWSKPCSVVRALAAFTAACFFMVILSFVLFGSSPSLSCVYLIISRVTMIESFELEGSLKGHLVQLPTMNRVIYSQHNLTSGLFCFPSRLNYTKWPFTLLHKSLFCIFCISIQESKDSARAATTTGSAGSAPSWGKQEFSTMVSKASD